MTSYKYFHCSTFSLKPKILGYCFVVLSSVQSPGKTAFFLLVNYLLAKCCKNVHTVGKMRSVNQTLKNKIYSLNVLE